MAAGRRLTALQVSKLTKPGSYAVGDGAYLQIKPGAGRSWVFRYMRQGKSHTMGLGPVALVTLAEAREKARQARRQILEGVDPLEARAAARARARLDTAKTLTFKEAAAAYINAHEAGWKNPKHAAQWPATLKAYAYPQFGDLAVSAIDTGLVIRALEPIWTAKPETAGRVRSRIENILDWAKVRGYRDGENPARWKGHLDKLLPKRGKVRKVKHHAALPYAELPGFMAELRERDSISARALEFTVLTAARTGEVIGATWAEIDLDNAVWTIPAQRMKAGAEHRVPLSRRAIQIIEGLPRILGNPHVFPGARGGNPLSNMAMLELVRGMRPGYVPHGFRSTFRDWAAEQTAYPNHVVEQALAHQISSAVEAAYRRGDLFEKRKRLMADWAEFCGSSSDVRRSVVPIRAPANA